MNIDPFVLKYVLGGAAAVGLSYVGWWFYLQHIERKRVHKEAKWTLEGDRRQ